MTVLLGYPWLVAGFVVLALLLAWFILMETREYPLTEEGDKVWTNHLCVLIVLGGTSVLLFFANAVAMGEVRL